jgi:uncharacterized FAD-dependent dehydrogenase
VIIVGAGPAGLFAAWRLALAGVPAVVHELGRDVQARKKDIARLMRHGQVDPVSNLCFGEGGAGTFSDGKLYTRSKDPQAVLQVLETLVHHGAPPHLLWEARPHVGTDRLAQLLVRLRAGLAERGVVIEFGSEVVDLLMAEQVGQRRVTGVRLATGEERPARAVVLAVGHSARRSYALLCERGIPLVAKAFAVGVRVEHPQELIDRIQYGAMAGAAGGLEPASYSVTHQAAAAAPGAAARGVYSFCMCPGGLVVPSATEPDGICLNGMSASRRNTPYANAALVVTVSPQDFGVRPPGDDAASDDEDEQLALAARHPELAGVAFQRRLERQAARAGGGAQRAPAQRFSDFLAGRASSTVPRVSYRPGVAAMDLGEVLPPALVSALRSAGRDFERRLRGFASSAATLMAVETRTSAPVQVLRDRTTLESPAVAGLYPCGEGAGHAGGISSSAVDGWQVAEAILSRLGH